MGGAGKQLLMWPSKHSTGAEFCVCILSPAMGSTRTRTQVGFSDVTRAFERHAVARVDGGVIARA